MSFAWPSEITTKVSADLLADIDKARGVSQAISIQHACDQLKFRIAALPYDVRGMLCQFLLEEGVLAKSLAWISIAITSGADVNAKFEKLSHAIAFNILADFYNSLPPSVQDRFSLEANPFMLLPGSKDTLMMWSAKKMVIGALEHFLERIKISPEKRERLQTEVNTAGQNLRAVINSCPHELMKLTMQEAYTKALSFSLPKPRTTDKRTTYGTFALTFRETATGTVVPGLIPGARM